MRGKGREVERDEVLTVVQWLTSDKLVSGGWARATYAQRVARGATPPNPHVQLHRMLRGKLMAWCAQICFGVPAEVRDRSACPILFGCQMCGAMHAAAGPTICKLRDKHRS